jgi:hypothetical protein
MLVISPRSYVTAAFDLIFPDLAEAIVEWLERLRPDDWWEYYINKSKVAVFGRVELNKRKEYFGKPFPTVGSIDDLMEHFDEYYLNKLINGKLNETINGRQKIHVNPKAEKPKEKVVAKRLEKLGIIRNDLAHRGKRALKKYRIEVDDKDWAVQALCHIRDFADYLNKPDVAKRISILLFKMKCDWIDKNTKLPPYRQLIEWLEKRVVNHVIAIDSTVEKAYRERIEKSWNNLKKYADESSEDTASRYVIDYYWNAIRSKTDIYEEITNTQKGIPTFEDVVEKFTDECYCAHNNY